MRKKNLMSGKFPPGSPIKQRPHTDQRQEWRDQMKFEPEQKIEGTKGDKSGGEARLTEVELIRRLHCMVTGDRDISEEEIKQSICRCIRAGFLTTGGKREGSI